MNIRQKAFLIASSITVGWPGAAFLANLVFGGNVAAFVLAAPIVAALFLLVFGGIYSLTVDIMKR